MTYYIESRNTDPTYNLALEQVVFDLLDPSHNYFMLWQNDNSIIVGKNQNTHAEINSAFVKEHNISVVRRLSGGGAVYHDLGNLNFTVICEADKDSKTCGFDFAEFCKPIQQALVSFGVPVEISGRNDMTIEGKKFSGNAQYVKKGRVMHHGTLLFDSNLEILSQSLNVTNEKIESKGIKSVKSRVTNIRPYLKPDMSIQEFWIKLKDFLFNYWSMKEYTLSSAEITEVQKLKDSVYSQWVWNYGASPSYNVRKSRRIEGCGSIEVLLAVEKGGIINNCIFYGDFFGNEDTEELSVLIKNHHLEYNELKELLAGFDVSRYFHALDTEKFLSLLLE